MKDTLVTARMKRRELKILLWCFLAANALNIAAIAAYGMRWTELFSQIGYVVCITLVFYAVVAGVRIVAGWFTRSKRRG